MYPGLNINWGIKKKKKGQRCHMGMPIWPYIKTLPFIERLPDQIEK
jgi:hypothetical protein